jgi:hypothetical protein
LVGYHREARETTASTGGVQRFDPDPHQMAKPSQRGLFLWEPGMGRSLYVSTGTFTVPRPSLRGPLDSLDGQIKFTKESLCG